MNVQMYRLSLALLCGVGLSAFATLLLNGPPWIAMPAVFLVFPGGLIAAFPFHSDSPFIVMAGNAVIYSGLTYFFLGIRRDAGTRFLRLASICLAVPVAALVALSCTPSVNPMFPHGMDELDRQEGELQKAFPDTMNLEEARAVLRTKNIQFEESTPSTGTILQRQDVTIQALLGDRLIYSRFQTYARQFPCGYDMEINLLFDATGKLKQRYIHRFRICP
jgi:hypothetical protein